MARISTYPVDSSVNGLDILIGSDADDANITKNYRIDSISAYTKSTLNLAAALILQGTSTVNQEPAGLDVPLQVTFGPAQNGPADPVELDVLGNIIFNQAGLYLLNWFVNFERQGGGIGGAVIAFRALINGIQVSPTKMVEIDSTIHPIPYELTIPITASAGDVLTWEIIRDSSGLDEGGLYTHTLLGGWSNVPSADVFVYKVDV